MLLTRCYFDKYFNKYVCNLNHLKENMWKLFYVKINLRQIEINTYKLNKIYTDLLFSFNLIALGTVQMLLDSIHLRLFKNNYMYSKYISNKHICLTSHGILNIR